MQTGKNSRSQTARYNACLRYFSSLFKQSSDTVSVIKLQAVFLRLMCLISPRSAGRNHTHLEVRLVYSVFMMVKLFFKYRK